MDRDRYKDNKIYERNIIYERKRPGLAKKRMPKNIKIGIMMFDDYREALKSLIMPNHMRGKACDRYDQRSNELK